MPDDQDPDRRNAEEREREQRTDHQLPWPEETDPARMGDRFAHEGSPEQRVLGEEFAHATEADRKRTESARLEQQFADPQYADNRRLEEAFADPNSVDDRRIGKNFAETNSTAKPKKPPLTERLHKPANRRPLYLFVFGFLLLFLLVMLAGLVPRHFRNKDNEERAKQEQDAKPVVETTKVVDAKDQAGLVLPATTTPLTEAYIYGRANGYLKKRLVDIGDHVREGQLLAVIDAPDLDAQAAQAREQLRQAQQQLEQQKSQLALATVTVQRYRVLVTKGVFSRQDGDQQEANYASQVANVAAAQRNVDAYRANLQRAIALQSFEFVRAPFSGIVTQRNVDLGALISAGGSTSGMLSGPAPQGQNSTTGGTQQAAQSNNAGSSGGTSSSATTAQSPGQGGPLFGIAQVNRLRTLVSVPEGFASMIHPGTTAQLSFQEFPGVVFHGDVTRTADSVDANTRTMLTEVQVDNHDGRLVSGMYTVVTFPPPPNTASPLLINGDAIAIRHDQSMVAVVADGKVRFVPVVIGRDFGTAVEILDGLKVGDVIVTDVTDDVVDGRAVQVHMAKGPEEQPQKAPPQNTPPGGNTRYGNQGITDQNLGGQQSQSKQQASGKSKGGNTGAKRGSSESKP